ncbi:MAG: carboxylesterase family protein [Planctomycetota bacterium]
MYSKTKYLVYLPSEYRVANKEWPLLLYLHGTGQRGDDAGSIVDHGPPRYIESGKEYPFIVLAPLCPKHSWWTNEVLVALLEDILSKYRVNEDKVYVTGHSMGGYGTWSIAMENPRRFAAIAPLSGGGMVERAKRLAHLPIWAFHGKEDTEVPLNTSTDMVEAIKNAGGSPKLTIYPDKGHDIQSEVYSNISLYEWLLKQSRSGVEEAHNQ